MKKCRHCGMEQAEDAVFCVGCGESTKTTGQQKKVVAICLSLVLVTGFVLVKDMITQEQSRKNLEDEQINRWVEDYLNTPKVTDITFKNDWEMNLKNDYYYVDGSITNTGSNPIRYYKITVNFLDFYGNVVDSDWTNGSNLGVGESQVVDLMHKKSSADIRKFEYFVTEVS